MAFTTTVQNVFAGNACLWYHVFQGPNTSWLTFDQRIIVGNFFLGLQGSSFQYWQANIPPRAIIESAVMRVTAFNTNLSAHTSDIYCPDRFADSNDVTPIANPSTHYTGWRRNFWSNAHMVLINTTFGSIATSGAGHNRLWPFRQITAATQPDGTLPTPGAGHREQMAQRFTTAAAGNLQVLNCTSQMQRTVVAPAGDFRLRIQTAVLAADGVTLIPGATLATSDLVSMAAFPAAFGNVVFGFTGADQITLDFSTTYFMDYVPDAHTINNVNYVSLRYQDTFLSTGLMMNFGEGLGADWQNAAGVVDVNFMVNIGNIAPPVSWAMPFFAVGVSYDSPDVSSLIQAQVDAPGYADSDRSVILGIRGLGGLSNRIYRNTGHPSNLPPRLTVTWRRRRVHVNAR